MSGTINWHYKLKVSGSVHGKGQVTRQVRYADSIEKEGPANELQVVGDPNSTDEGMKQINPLFYLALTKEIR